MKKLSKRILKLREGLDLTKPLSVEDAVKAIKERATAKFDETLELAMNLNVDPRKADQAVRGMIDLPHGTGKTVRVAVFAGADKAAEAQKAGADLVGSDELAEQIQAGVMNFDVLIATPDQMATIGKLGKILGPRGLMPNPKLGTVTMDVAAEVKAAKAGQVQFRAEKAGIVHGLVGKASFDLPKLLDNAKTFVQVVNRAKPATIKGNYIKSIYLTSSQGPSVRVDPASFQ
jgi:large subunit ribosomal protein L1